MLAVGCCDVVLDEDRDTGERAAVRRLLPVGQCSDGERVRIDLAHRVEARPGAVIGRDAGEVGLRQRGRTGASVNQRLLHIGETGVADLESLFHYLFAFAQSTGAGGGRRQPILTADLGQDFPAVALEEFVAFVRVGRSMLRERLDITAGAGRGVEKQHAAGFVAGVLPGMRDVARHERAGAGPADGDLVTDLECELAGEHPGDLIAVVVQMEEACGAGGQGFLEHHDALASLAAEQLQVEEAAWRRRVEMLPAARGYDKAFCRGHVAVLPVITSLIRPCPCRRVPSSPCRSWRAPGPCRASHLAPW